MTNKNPKPEKAYIRRFNKYPKNLQWRVQVDYEAKLSKEELIWLRKWTEVEYGGNVKQFKPYADDIEVKEAGRIYKQMQNDGLSNLITGGKTTDVYSVRTIRKSHGKNYEEDATNELFHFRHMTARHKKAA